MTKMAALWKNQLYKGRYNIGIGTIGSYIQPSSYQETYHKIKSFMTKGAHIFEKTIKTVL